MSTRSKQQEQLAVAILSLAKDLATSWTSDKACWNDAQAAHDAASGTRREKVLELAKMTADGSESACCNLTPLQASFIGVFQKEAWKGLGGKGNPDLSVKGSQGLLIISSQIKSVLLAANCAASKILTLGHKDPASGSKDPWEAERDLHAMPSWRALLEKSSEIRHAAVRAQLIPEEFGPKSRRPKGSTKRTAGKVAQILAGIHTQFYSATDGRTLCQEALRCFTANAPTGESRQRIMQLTERYILEVGQALETGARATPLTPQAGQAAVNTPIPGLGTLNAETLMTLRELLLGLPPPHDAIEPTAPTYTPAAAAQISPAAAAHQISAKEAADKLFGQFATDELKAKRVRRKAA